MWALALEDRDRAEAEAQRLFGSAFPADIAPARRDAIYLLCFSAACTGFTDWLREVRARRWNEAAGEVVDSLFATDPAYPGRMRQAERIARWILSGSTELV